MDYLIQNVLNGKTTNVQNGHIDLTSGLEEFVKQSILYI
jgi:hypothetical protein